MGLGPTVDLRRHRGPTRSRRRRTEEVKEELYCRSLYVNFTFSLVHIEYFRTYRTER